MGVNSIYRDYMVLQRMSCFRSKKAFCNIPENCNSGIFMLLSALLAIVIYEIIHSTIIYEITFILCKHSEILIVALLR